MGCGCESRRNKLAARLGVDPALVELGFWTFLGTIGLVVAAWLETR